jgi:hypothetical protein
MASMSNREWNVKVSIAAFLLLTLVAFGAWGLYAGAITFKEVFSALALPLATALGWITNDIQKG